MARLAPAQHCVKLAQKVASDKYYNVRREIPHVSSCFWLVSLETKWTHTVSKRCLWHMFDFNFHRPDNSTALVYKKMSHRILSWCGWYFPQLLPSSPQAAFGTGPFICLALCSNSASGHSNTSVKSEYKLLIELLETSQLLFRFTWEFLSDNVFKMFFENIILLLLVFFCLLICLS